MEEQLPTPLIELIILNLYLGSITYTFALIFIVLVMRANSFRWMNLLYISTLTIILSFVGSFLIWSLWSTSYDLMIGPIHIPTFLSLIVVTPLLLVIFGNRLRITKLEPNK